MSITTATQATAAIENKSAELMNQYTGIAQSQGDNASRTKLAEFQQNCDVKVAGAENAINNIQVQHGTLDSPAAQAAAQAVMSETTQALSADAEQTSVSFTDFVSVSFNYILLDFTTSITSYANKISASVSGFDASTLISKAVSSMGAALTKMKDSLVAAFKTAIAKILNTAIGLVNGILSKIMARGLALLDKANKIKKQAYDFYKRAKEQSSTSLYIQANVPDVTGKVKANAAALANTPDKVIMEANLKKEVNKVKEMAKNPLAALLGFVGSLIPKESSKKIEEPKSKADLNKYGETFVTETKGGAVEIITTTPGNNTSTKIYPNGSSERVLDDGSKVNKTVGNITQVTEGEWQITTTKDKVEIVVGDEKIEIRKNYFMNLLGNSDVTIGGHSNEVVTKEVYNDYKSDFTEKVAGNVDETVGGNKKETISGDLTSEAKNHKHTVKGYLTIIVNGNVNVSSAGSVTVAGAKGINLAGKTGTLQIK